MKQKCVFLVHTLTSIQRRLLALRGARLALATGGNDGTDPKDISTLARFFWQDPQSSGVEIHCEVVGIPLLPEQLLQDQNRAVDRMMRAVNWSAKNSGFPSAVGLGSLCAVVAGRGKALQERLNVPVTTGYAATTWALYQNTLDLHQRVGGNIAVVGASTPVGRAVVYLLDREGLNVFCDSKKAARKTHATSCSSPEEAVQAARLVVGAAPIGPSVQSSAFRAGMSLIDIALPSSVEGVLPEGVQVFSGEAMSMPKHWKRGFWGPIYHLVSGYGLNAVLACLVEPVALVYSKSEESFALGAQLDINKVEGFGKAAQMMGFHPLLRRKRLLLKDSSR